MKQLKRSYTRSARLLFAALLLLMIAGSVYDFQISSFLYPGKESSLASFRRFWLSSARGYCCSGIAAA